MIVTLQNLFGKIFEKALLEEITRVGTLREVHQTIAKEMHSSRVVISRLLKRLEVDQKIRLHRNAIELIAQV